MVNKLKFAGRKFTILEISTSRNIQKIKCPRGKFACLIVSNGKATIFQRESVCKPILEKDCEYAVCSLSGSDLWEDSFDNAFLEKYNFKPPKSSYFMTTSHKGRKLDEALDFLLFLAHDSSKSKNLFDNFLIVIINPKKKDSENLVKQIKMKLKKD